MSKRFEGTWLPIGFEKRFKSKSGWMDWIGKVGVSGLGLNLLPLRSLEDLLLDAWRMSVLLDKEARLIQAQREY